MRIRHGITGLLLVAATALLGCQVSPSTLNLDLQNGTLRVAVRSPRSVQAYLADIDHLIVGIQTPFTTATQSIAAQAINNGSASATFESLKPGDATVSVEAFSATGSIGLATASATIEPLKIKDVDLPLTLAPNYDYRGNVALGVTVQDGPDIVVTPTPEYLLLDVTSYDGWMFSINGGVPTWMYDQTFDPAIPMFVIKNSTAQTLQLHMHVNNGGCLFPSILPGATYTSEAPQGGISRLNFDSGF